MMRIWVNIVIVAMIFSGCATMKVTKMADIKTVKKNRVISAYFNPNKNKILLDTRLFYKGVKKSTKMCFEFTVNKLKGENSYPNITFKEKLLITCSDIDKDYIFMPIKYKSDKYYYLPKIDSKGKILYHVPVRIATDAYIFLSENSKDTVKSPFVPWAIKAKDNEIYLVNSEKKNASLLSFPEGSEATNPEAYLLYPFSLTLDIVTLPITAPFYILYFAYDAYFQNAMRH